MSDTVADDLIRSFFERWEHLEEEKRTISDDLKELFAEARGNGLDPKALRAVFREQVGDQNALNEFDAICDLYRASLNRPRAGRTRTHEEANSPAMASGRPVVGLPATAQMGPHAVTAGETAHSEVAQAEAAGQGSAPVQVSNPALATNSQSAVALSAADEPEASPTPTPNASGTLSDDGIPAFLKREVAA